MSANAKHTPVVDIHGQALDAQRIAYRCDVDKETAFVMAETPALLAALKDCAELMEDFRNANGAGPKSCGHVFYCICASDRFEAAKSAARAAIARAEGGKP